MDEMESLGKYLKRERELRNIPLREVAKNTRVREHLLRAIEEDQFELLPSAAYVRGFLSTYAKYIGLDPNDVILRYERILKVETIIHPEIQTKRKISWNKKQAWIVIGVVMVSSVVSYFFYPPRSKPPVESIPVKPVVKKTSPLTPSPPIAGTTVVPQEKPFSLQLKAVEETWVSIQINGQPEREATFKPGEGESFRALNRIILIVGNAGGLDLVFNQRPLERFGKSGEVVTLIFTPQGVEMKRREKPKPSL